MDWFYVGVRQYCLASKHHTQDLSISKDYESKQFVWICCGQTNGITLIEVGWVYSDQEVFLWRYCGDLAILAACHHHIVACQAHPALVKRSCVRTVSISLLVN